MHIQAQGYALPIQKALVQLIESELAQAVYHDKLFVVLNFKDPTYSPMTGGYHPVEIMLNNDGHIQYITDFCYIGHQDDSELVKELDFDFSAGILQQMGRIYAIEQAWELFDAWQKNFCEYYSYEVFQVSITYY